MAGGIKRRSRTEGSKTTTQPKDTGIRTRARTPVTPGQLRHRIRTEGSGQTPTRTVPGSALSKTGDVRSRSRTEKPTPSRLRDRSRTEGAAPRAKGIRSQEKISIDTIMRLLREYNRSIDKRFGRKRTPLA